MYYNHTMEEGQYITIERVHNFVCEVLKKKGIDENDAKLTADVLVSADARGIKSHGVTGGTGIDTLINKIDAGFVNIDYKPEIKKAAPTILVADAKLCLPYPLAFKMCEQLKKIANKFGIAKGYIINANHYGIGGIYTEFIAQEGKFEGKSNCTTSAVMKLLGGNKARLGTNLIAHSIPYKNENKKINFLTVDMATSVHAASWAIIALKDNKQIPFDYAYYINPKGNPSKDPKDYYEDGCGSIAPMGVGFDTNGNISGVPYKGLILAQMIEADCGLAGGNITGIDTKVKTEAINNLNVSQVFEVQKIDFVYEKEEILKRVQELVKDWKSYGSEVTLMPGEKEHKEAEKSKNEGIFYNKSQIERLEKIGIKLGVKL